MASAGAGHSWAQLGTAGHAWARRHAKYNGRRYICQIEYKDRMQEKVFFNARQNVRFLFPSGRGSVEVKLKSPLKARRMHPMYHPWLGWLGLESDAHNDRDQTITSRNSYRKFSVRLWGAPTSWWI